MNPAWLSKHGVFFKPGAYAFEVHIMFQMQLVNYVSQILFP